MLKKSEHLLLIRKSPLATGCEMLDLAVKPPQRGIRIPPKLHHEGVGGG